jgi:cation diffusion facilitator CzcD-associated flavoprotein CzcO
LECFHNQAAAERKVNMTHTVDVAVLGAGPYGLAAGAHLHKVAGLDVQVFGEPMEFWKAQMPQGMLLRSPWSASHISDPAVQFDFAAYRQQLGRAIPAPIPLDDFVSYGLWFQQHTAPSLIRNKVKSVVRGASNFQLTLDNGDSWNARKVVIAGGIGPFARRPEVFSGLFPQFVTHCSDQRDLSRFKGKRVAVIGAGQSALETAALIHEGGAEVELLVKAPNVHWLGWRAKLQKLGPLAKLLYAPTDVGPAGVSRIVSKPNLVKYFPRSIQNRFRTRSLRPAGSKWLFERLKNVPIRTSCHVVSATPAGERLHLKLNDGTLREVDHVLLGTGFQVDISRYSFLSSEIIQSIDRAEGFPLLNTGFESSVPGLHFLGAPSSWTFGPLMYFVAGTEFAARTVAQHISRAKKKS